MALTTRELDQVRQEITSPLRDDLHQLDGRVDAVEKRVESLEQRFAAFAQQTADAFGQLNTQLGRLVDLVAQQGRTLEEIRDKMTP